MQSPYETAVSTYSPLTPEQLEEILGPVTEDKRKHWTFIRMPAKDQQRYYLTAVPFCRAFKCTIEAIR
jgi:hypothetical protein